MYDIPFFILYYTLWKKVDIMFHSAFEIWNFKVVLSPNKTPKTNFSSEKKKYISPQLKYYYIKEMLYIYFPYSSEKSTIIHIILENDFFSWKCFNERIQERLIKNEQLPIFSISVCFVFSLYVKWAWRIGLQFQKNWKKKS